MTPPALRCTNYYWWPWWISAFNWVWEFFVTPRILTVAATKLRQTRVFGGQKVIVKVRLRQLLGNWSLFVAHQVPSRRRWASTNKPWQRHPLTNATIRITETKKWEIMKYCTSASGVVMIFLGGFVVRGFPEAMFSYALWRWVNFNTF